MEGDGERGEEVQMIACQRNEAYSCSSYLSGGGEETKAERVSHWDQNIKMRWKQGEMSRPPR